MDVIEFEVPSSSDDDSTSGESSSGTDVSLIKQTPSVTITLFIELSYFRFRILLSKQQQQLMH